MADAIAAVTGCRLGKRTLKHMDYGKCAYTFVDTATGYAVRILARDDARESVWRYVSRDLNKGDAQREAYKIMSDELLFKRLRWIVRTVGGQDARPAGSRAPFAARGLMIGVKLGCMGEGFVGHVRKAVTTGD